MKVSSVRNRGQYERLARACRVSVISALASLLVVISSAAQAVDNIEVGYAGADDGDWGGKKGAATGPADGTCANMGAVGKVNLLSNFGFSIPDGATIGIITAFIKAASQGGQNIGVQLATDATVDPPTGPGTLKEMGTINGAGGSCAETDVTSIGGAQAFWGTALTPAQIRSTTFGLVFTKLVTSEVKVDSVCLEIEYTTAEGPAVVENCFAEPPEPSNTITVIKSVVGEVPGSDWAFTGDLGAFSLPAGGGFDVFPDLVDDTYTITETTKAGYDVTVECLEGENVVVAEAATNTVNVPVAADISVTCFFTNTIVGDFTVIKDFTDDNGAAVNMTLTCTSGTVTNNPQPASDGGPDAVFVVEGYEAGATCTATEATPGGYSGNNSDCQDDDDINDSCTIVNTPIPPPENARFKVTKDFSDDNDAIVNVHLSCFGGSTLDQDKMIWEGQPVVFNVENFQPGTNCAVTEGSFPGYTTEYSGDCVVNDIEGIEYECFITNTLDPVILTVHKVWVFEGEGGDAVDGDYKIDIFCPAGTMVDPDYSNGSDIEKFSVYNNTSNKNFTVAVYPDWDGGTTCWAEEDVKDNSVETHNGCGSVTVHVNSGNSCTITNTVFFEGIPTLSRFGMAILALLMLGVGFVGFRRFV